MRREESAKSRTAEAELEGQGRDEGSKSLPTHESASGKAVRAGNGARKANEGRIGGHPTQESASGEAARVGNGRQGGWEGGKEKREETSISRVCQEQHIKSVLEGLIEAESNGEDIRRRRSKSLREQSARIKSSILLQRDCQRKSTTQQER